MVVAVVNIFLYHKLSKKIFKESQKSLFVGRRRLSFHKAMQSFYAFLFVLKCLFGLPHVEECNI